MLKKTFLFVLALLLSLYSSFAAFSLSQKFIEMSQGFNNLFSSADFVSFAMFAALFFGIFSLIKALLSLAFKNHLLGSEKKAKNVIAFMISFIGVSGIFFMYGAKDAHKFVLLLGGTFGFLIITILVFLIMQLFLSMANSLVERDDDGKISKNYLSWLFVIILGTLTSLYLLIGFTAGLLSELGCGTSMSKVIGDFKGVPLNLDDPSNYVCSESTVLSWMLNLFLSLLNFILPFAIIIGLIVGWQKLFGSKKSESEDGEILEEEKQNDIKINEIKDLVKGFSSSLKSARKEVENKEKALDNLQKALRGKM